MISSRLAPWCAAVLYFACLPSAIATPIDFDCDAASDRFSSISQALDGPAIITGSISPRELRAGEYLPVAGARFVLPDSQDGLGFQLAGDIDQPGVFEVILNVRKDGIFTTKTVGQIKIKEQVSFNFSVSEGGLGILDIQEIHFTVNFVPVPKGQAMILCSTGQFKFLDLVFGRGASTGYLMPHQEER